MKILNAFALGILAIGAAMADQDVPKTLDGAYQVRYASNLTFNDAIINITNTGANGNSLFGPGYGEPAGNICVNIYAFSPDEQLVSCCSCLVTPNGLVHVTANNDLVSNTLTGIRPDSIVIKLVATSTGSVANTGTGADSQPRLPTYDGASCTNSAAQAGGDKFLISSGMLAWGTSSHSDWDPIHPDELYITETQFLPSTLSKDELKSITNRCTNIIGNGSSFGICRSCRLGGLGGSKL